MQQPASLDGRVKLLENEAIALVDGCTLLSRNLVDFQKVPGLVVEDWTRP